MLKKLVSLSLALTLCLSLCACASSAPTEIDTTTKFTSEGFTLSVPNEYADLLIVDTTVSAGIDGTFFSVHEKASVEAVKEAGSVWAVPVIDLGALSGLYPMADAHKQYFTNKDTDALHPNDAGHERMARTLMYQLIPLPCTF